MRRLLSSVFCLAALVGAQAPVLDVGLTVDAGPLPVILGQQCGPVTCVALPAGSVPRGQARTFAHASAPVTPFVLGIALPGSCVAFAGVANSLLLDSGTLQVVAAGVTSAPPFVPTPCQQGVALFVLNVPSAAPVGLVFRVQGLGVSNNGQTGFGPALELSVQ